MTPQETLVQLQTLGAFKTAPLFGFYITELAFLTTGITRTFEAMRKEISSIGQPPYFAIKPSVLEKVNNILTNAASQLAKNGGGSRRNRQHHVVQWHCGAPLHRHVGYAVVWCTPV